MKPTIEGTNQRMKWTDDIDVLVTICARGGSKRVPDKHIKKLHGKPLISHTIEQAQAWGKGKIIVSSDSFRILSLVPPGILTHIRHKTLAEDTTPKVPVIRDALETAERVYDKEFQTIIDLDATAPLRTVEDIEGCYQKFIGGNYLTLFSVVPDGPNPRFNMVEYKADGTLNLCIPDEYWQEGVRHSQGIRRPTFCVNSNIYVYSRNWLVDSGSDSCLVPNHTGIYPMHKRSLIHIDTPEDWETVEEIIGGMNEG